MLSIIIARFGRNLKLSGKTLLKTVAFENHQPMKKAFISGLLQRLKDKEYVLCAEGYLFEFERRGYLQAGAFVPEVVVEHPDLVEALHREFVHAGSDVVEAFTVSCFIFFVQRFTVFIK